MQKITTVKIDKKTFTIKELPMKAVWELINNEHEGEGESFADRFQRLLALACPELTKEALLELYPSEIKELWTAFEEVNTDFLELMRRVGMDQALIDAVAMVIKTSIAQFACSLPAVTVQ